MREQVKGAMVESAEVMKRQKKDIWKFTEKKRVRLNDAYMRAKLM